MQSHTPSSILFSLSLSFSRWHARYTITESPIAWKYVRMKWPTDETLVSSTTRQARLCLCVKQNTLARETEETMMMRCSRGNYICLLRSQREGKNGEEVTGRVRRSIIQTRRTRTQLSVVQWRTDFHIKYAFSESVNEVQYWLREREREKTNWSEEHSSARATRCH